MFTWPWIRDTAERALATWIEVFLGFVIVAAAADLASLRAAAVGALFASLPAALSVLKSAIGTKIGNPESGSFLK